ncbi:winged helix-turn-helix transcriptional regulator [Candidatus Obscuribacterales bacterium]|nr:winged helix-turn-helix transcriptional regulator [Candidatus Obscuribacterales bacterium]
MRTPTHRLRELEEWMVVKRVACHEVPSVVEYELAERGKELIFGPFWVLSQMRLRGCKRGCRPSSYVPVFCLSFGLHPFGLTYLCVILGSRWQSCMYCAGIHCKCLK